MSPAGSCTATRTISFPRVSGDEPWFYLGDDGKMRFPRVSGDDSFTYWAVIPPDVFPA